MNSPIQLPDPLDPDKIKQNLKTKRIASKILIYNRTASTNDIAAEYAKNIKNDGLVVLAEQQTKGRGRAANKWQSNHGDSILCSILLTKSTLKPELLSLTAAVATAEAISEYAKIKWPNDIILNNKKIAGILLESKPFPQYTAHIIGIGINCHQKKDSFPAELKSTATSIDMQTPTTSDRTAITKRLLTSVEYWLDMATRNTRQVIEHWQKLSTQLHHRVTLIYNGTKFTGNCIGLDPQKGLILQLDSGATRFFPAAHTTIAKD